MVFASRNVNHQTDSVGNQGSLFILSTRMHMATSGIKKVHKANKDDEAVKEFIHIGWTEEEEQESRARREGLG